VLPASYRVDFDLLKKAVRANKVQLAGEREFKNLFPDCEVGAMPPFGNLYDMEVFVAESLAEAEEIAFNAASHTELIKMSYRDFATQVRPKVMKFSYGQ
jgi:Ala-tRNA(Pro) deacylase